MAISLLADTPAQAQQLSPGLRNAAIDEALAGEIGNSSTGQSLEESADSLRQYCKGAPKEPRCYEITRGGPNRSGQLTELCRKDPFHKRCEQYKQKSFDYADKIARMCEKDPHGRKCQRMKQRMENRPNLIH